MELCFSGTDILCVEAWTAAGRPALNVDLLWTLVVPLQFSVALSWLARYLLLLKERGGLNSRLCPSVMILLLWLPDHVTYGIFYLVFG